MKSSLLSLQGYILTASMKVKAVTELFLQCFGNSKTASCVLLKLSGIDVKGIRWRVLNV